MIPNPCEAAPGILTRKTNIHVLSRNVVIKTDLYLGNGFKTNSKTRLKRSGLLEAPCRRYIWTRFGLTKVEAYLDFGPCFKGHFWVRGSSMTKERFRFSDKICVVMIGDTGVYQIENTLHNSIDPRSLDCGNTKRIYQKVETTVFRCSTPKLKVCHAEALRIQCSERKFSPLNI